MVSDDDDDRLSWVKTRDAIASKNSKIFFDPTQLLKNAPLMKL